MRLNEEIPYPDAAAFADGLGGTEACACPNVFKEDVAVVTKKLEGFGLKQGYAEEWVGAGLHGRAFAAEFDTPDHAASALAYMKAELFRECINEPYCSNRESITNDKIPNFVGEAVTPLRPKNEGRRATLYKFVFQSGTAIYGVMDGADDAYDAGSVSRAQALALVQRFYDRVKNKRYGDVLQSAPASPLGPPHGPPPGANPSP